MLASSSRMEIESSQMVWEVTGKGMPLSLDSKLEILLSCTLYPNDCNDSKSHSNNQQQQQQQRQQQQ